VAAGDARSSVGRLTRRLAEHARLPVYREGYALVLGAGLSAALGFVYWIVAAHAYDARAVGLNSAAISTMMLVSGVAQLNLIGGLVRFVPTAGRSTWRLVAWSYAISVVVAIAVSLVFLLAVRGWAPSLAFLSSDDGFAFWFVAGTMAFCVFNLQDAVLTGLRRAIWVPVDNTLFGVAKIGLLALFVPLFPRFGIFASWTFSVVLSVVAINTLLIMRLIPAHARAPVETPENAGARQIGRFVAADYVGGLSWIVAITLIPIVVTERIGAAENAYYSLAWVIAIPLYTVSASTASSLVVTLVSEPRLFREHTHRVLVQTARLVVPAMALSSIPVGVTALYTAVWRAEKRLALLVWVRCAQNSAVVVFSFALLGPYGIRGPAFVWLAVQTVVAVALVAAWPHVLLTPGSTVPWRLRSLRLARNAAADTGLLTVFQAVKRRPAIRRRRAHAAVAVPRILAQLPPSGADPPPSAWTTYELPTSVTDKLVVLAGAPGGPPRAVVKLAESQQAAAGLARETEVLGLLAADPRLASWRSVLPEVLGAGEVDGKPFRVEAVLPGSVASATCRLGALADAIEQLHRRTGSEVEIGPVLLADWVDAPIAVLDHHTRRAGGRERWHAKALDRLRDELGEALAGRRLGVGWAHGDYVPGNLLVDPATGRVSGIVDWELAGGQRLQALDLVQLLLAARALRRRREYGEIVTEALAGALADEERAVLDRGAAPRGLPPSVLVRLAWLGHTQSLLTKAEGYAGNWLWQRSNLEAPLAALA
jgi:Phosphotransferase enzyme family